MSHAETRSRSLPPLLDHTLTLKKTAPESNPACSGAGYTPDIEQGYTVSHNNIIIIHAHKSYTCMHVAVRILHSSAFILLLLTIR